MNVETYTLFELNEYIRRVVALNFQEPIWITCEISSAKNSRGNYYIDFIQQDENDNVIAQSSAAIWYKNFIFLRGKLGNTLEDLLQPGIEVRVKVLVEFNERYGIKLIIEDIDPTYTLGKLELSKQQIIERLAREELLELNKTKNLPRVIQNIAVISSANAAGFIDFKNHLEQNNFGYVYQFELFNAALQGQNTEKEIIDAMNLIHQKPTSFDVIIIIRGGGSKLDLSAFDNYQIAKSIALSKIPVLTGIGHEIDTTITDFVAHTSFKTPTAVANFIIDQTLKFESEIVFFQQEIFSTIKTTNQQYRSNLELINHFVQNRAKEIIGNQKIHLNFSLEKILQSSELILKNEMKQLKHFTSLISASNPKNILKRGFALIKKDSQYLTSKKLAEKHNQLIIEYIDGEIEVNKL